MTDLAAYFDCPYCYRTSRMFGHLDSGASIQCEYCKEYSVVDIDSIENRTYFYQKYAETHLNPKHLALVVMYVNTLIHTVSGIGSELVTKDYMLRTLRSIVQKFAEPPEKF